jgi:tyrosyl-tRNA synthetase
MPGALVASAFVSVPSGVGTPLPAGAQLETLLRGRRDGSSVIITEEELGSRLARAASEGRPLRVKLGIDPSRPDLHLGHAVVLRKLRQFQDLGHTAVLIIGDFTGRVGDPSGRSETRPLLTEEAIRANARTYFEQAGAVLDMERAEVRSNSEWLGAMRMADVLKLTSSYTVARMLERDDFQARYRAGEPISVVEFLYPLMQAMDSVAVRADVELGGTDQTFNLLVGRDIQRAYGQEPQIVFTLPLLVGTDGTRKMSKSFDNSIAFTDRPEEMFGKVMSIPDAALETWEPLATTLSPEALADVALSRQDMPEVARRKRRLAKAVVRDFYGSEEAERQERRFDRVHREGAVPDEVAESLVPSASLRDGRVWLPRLLVDLGLAASNGEAKRKIAEGAVRIDGDRVADADQELPVERLLGRVVQVGRRRFVRIVAVDGAEDGP